MICNCRNWTPLIAMALAVCDAWHELTKIYYAQYILCWVWTHIYTKWVSIRLMESCSRDTHNDRWWCLLSYFSIFAGLVCKWIYQITIVTYWIVLLIVLQLQIRDFCKTWFASIIPCKYISYKKVNLASYFWIVMLYRYNRCCSGITTSSFLHL